MRAIVPSLVVLLGCSSAPATVANGGGGDTMSASDGGSILDLLMAGSPEAAPVDSGRRPVQADAAPASTVYRHPDIVARIKAVPQVFGGVLSQPAERAGQILFPYDNMPMGLYCWKDLGASTPPDQGRIGSVWDRGTGTLANLKGIWFTVERLATEAEIAGAPGGLKGAIDSWIDALLVRGTNPMTGRTYLDEGIERLNETKVGATYTCKSPPGGP